MYPPLNSELSMTKAVPNFESLSLTLKKDSRKYQIEKYYQNEFNLLKLFECTELKY